MTSFDSALTKHTITIVITDEEAGKVTVNLKKSNKTSEVELVTYKMSITDDKTNEISYYEVTRDTLLLKEIKEKLGRDYPIVLHGASSVPKDLVEKCNMFGATIENAMGVPEEMLAEASKMGVVKINTDTDLRLAFTGAIRKMMNENPEEFDPRKYLGPAREAVKEVVKRKIEIFGSKDKA